MSLTTKVVYPTPPPTTNDLSSRQRIQLLRKAKKLEQILGVTPCPVDNASDPIHVALPRRPIRHRLNNTGRESIDSTSSTSSCGSLSPAQGRAPSVPVSSHFTSSINSYDSQASSSSVSLIDSLETSPSKANGPAMRFVMKTPILDKTPASPFTDNMFPPKSSPQSPNRKLDVLFLQFTPIPSEEPSLCDSAIVNSDITSLYTLRRQKMDRLRRKFGEDVPFDLVFPPSQTGSRRSRTPLADLFADVNKECDTRTPTPTPLVRKSSGRISTARDSIVHSTSVHRAKRQPSIRSPTATHKRSGSTLSEHKQITSKLSFIIESPDEHGTGCAEEFGQSGNNTKFKSEWIVSTGGTDVKLWSTRRGYEGWLPNSPSEAPQIPPLSLPPLFPSNAALKLRPSSYRKPVPSIPDDCC